MSIKISRPDIDTKKQAIELGAIANKDQSFIQLFIQGRHPSVALPIPPQPEERYRDFFDLWGDVADYKTLLEDIMKLHDIESPELLEDFAKAEEAINKIKFETGKGAVADMRQYFPLWKPYSDAEPTIPCKDALVAGTFTTLFTRFLSDQLPFNIKIVNDEGTVLADETFDTFQMLNDMMQASVFYRGLNTNKEVAEAYKIGKAIATKLVPNGYPTQFEIKTASEDVRAEMIEEEQKKNREASPKKGK